MFETLMASAAWVPQILREGEGTGAGDQPPTEPPATTEAPPEGQPAPAEGEPPAEGQPPAEAEGQPPAATEGQPAGEPEKPKQTPWFTKRIGDLTRQKTELQRRAEGLEQSLGAIAQRLGVSVEQLIQLQSQEQPSTRPQPNGQGGGQKQYYTQAEVEAAAAEMAQTQAFNDACNSAAMKGQQEFGVAFQQTLGFFQNQMGGLHRDIIEGVLEVEEPHKVLHQLAQDPEKAVEIWSLPPGPRRAAAVVKYAAVLGQKAPAKVSGAPAPIRPQIGGNQGRGEPRIDDPNLDMKTWVKLREKQSAAGG